MGEKVYFEATRREVDWMVDNLGLSPTSSLLDLGCGSGRIPLGILDRVGEIREYRGVDVDKRFLGWARRHITSEHPNFQFIHLDAKNDYYNPGGEKMGRNFRRTAGKPANLRRFAGPPSSRSPWTLCGGRRRGM
jgi:SAM-dependent methyltransferase